MKVQTDAEYMLRLIRMAGDAFIQSSDPLIANVLKNGRCGYISLRKVSENAGYLDPGCERHGITYNFCEGASVFVITDTADEEYYYTSTVEYIGKNHFGTKNSKYEYTFRPMILDGCDRTVYGNMTGAISPSAEEVTSAGMRHMTFEDMDTPEKARRLFTGSVPNEMTDLI
jgi:hypothetical protein